MVFLPPGNKSKLGITEFKWTGMQNVMFTFVKFVKQRFVLINEDKQTNQFSLEWIISNMLIGRSYMGKNFIRSTM